MPLTSQPLPDSAIILGNAVADKILGRVSICVGGGRGDVGLPLQSLPQVAITAPDVLLQGMPPVCFINR